MLEKHPTLHSIYLTLTMDCGRFTHIMAFHVMPLHDLMVNRGIGSGWMGARGLIPVLRFEHRSSIEGVSAL